MSSINAIPSAFPSPEQNALISRADRGESLLVVAGPGTGKSRTALAMALQKVGTLAPESLARVLFLSFSNATIGRLAASAGVRFSKADRKRLRFMTFHSCAAELLSRYGRFVGLPGTTRVIDRLEERLIAIQTGWDERGLDYGDRLGSLSRREGCLAFSVLLPLGATLLSSSETLRRIISRHYPLIIVDEFQDTSADQWTFLQQLGQYSQVVAFGDPNQIIYTSLHQATERRLGEFTTWKKTEVDSTLARNHRCAQAKILEFADCLLTATYFAPSDSDPVKFGSFYRNQLRGSLALLWKQIQDKIGAGQTIGILLPSNALVEDVSSGLRNPPPGSPIRFPVYAQIAKDAAAYDAVLLALAAIKDYASQPSQLLARKAAVALLAMNSSWDSRSTSSLERLSQIADVLASCRLGDGSAIGRLFESVHTETPLCGSLYCFIQALDQLPAFKRSAKRLIAHPGLAFLSARSNERSLPLFDQLLSQRLPKGLEGDEAFEGKTHVLTYHKSKGREFDYTVLVVDPRHESTKSQLAERRRLYYVAATRARKWLGVVFFGADHGSVLGPTLLKPAR
jgi:DNA helicase II / ATP-dependent DNA helicase PcrA